MHRRALVRAISYSEYNFACHIDPSFSAIALVQLFTVASASSPNSLTGGERKLHTYIRPLGATTIAMGLIVLFIGSCLPSRLLRLISYDTRGFLGVSRYFAIQTALTKGYFPAPRLVMGAIALSLAVLVTLTFGILVAGKLEPNGLV